MNIVGNSQNLFTTKLPVGYYDLGGIKFAIFRRPSWLQRRFARWLLGWEWRDAQ
jgi:hypothetical protein